jgi:oxygen-independent coproporphyrinogen-3 oxidase
MAGIYFHIPFCHTRCSYCDFYKSTQVKFKPELIQAILRELELRADYLTGETVETVYFGGGTPSVLTKEELEAIFSAVYKLFSVSARAEVTFEANPDDLTRSYLDMLVATPINRLSIGIQSFDDQILQKMRRRHNSSQAVECVDDAFKAGFDNLSIDLIYGLPGLEPAQWEQNLLKAVELPVKHLSAYHLTYHEGTHFYDLLHKGIIREAGEDDSFLQFETLIDTAAQHGFEHYEISNFARDGKISKHNYGYWFGLNYLGIGPSAHSYNGKSRSWNIPDLFGYMKQIGQRQLPQETEVLSNADRYNDYIITRLRTKWGISDKTTALEFGEKYASVLKETALKYMAGGYILHNDGHYTLTRKGYFISDRITEDLMIIEPA